MTSTPIRSPGSSEDHEEGPVWLRDFVAVRSSGLTWRSGIAKATFRIWRGNAEQGAFKDYPTEVSEGMVVLDAVHRIQAEQAGDLAVRWNCKAGKCGSCSAEINGKPRLMCMTRLDTLDLSQPVTVEPMQAFPLIKDLVTDVSWNYKVKQAIKPFKPRKPDAPDGTWRMQPARRRSRPGIPQVHRVLPVPGRLPHPARPSPARRVHRAALPALHRRARDAPARHRGSAARAQGATTASATATSRAAAPRSAPSTSPSPRTRSFRSRNGWSIGSTIR